MDGNNPYFTPPSEQPPFWAPLSEKKEATGKSLLVTGTVVGCGFLGYLLFGMLYSLLLRSVPVLNRMYFEDPLYKYLLEILYSFFCVGLPFVFVFLALRVTRANRTLSIPLGRPAGGGRALLLVPAGLAVCFIGSLLSNYFAIYADAAGFGFNSFYEALKPEPLPDGPMGFVVLTLRSAVVPAFVEEFVFRGVLLQSLKKRGEVFAVVCTSVLFGLMHANMTQVPFAIIAGLALGYCAAVTGSLWISIAVHFCNNFVSVLVTAVGARAGEAAGATVSAVAVYGGIALGALCAVLYLALSREKARLRPEEIRVKNKTAYFFLSPTLLIAIGWLIWYTLNDIVPFAAWLEGA